MRILLPVVAAVCAVLASHGLAQEPATDRIVNVLNWSDYIDPSVLDDFTAETGIKVAYDTYDSAETIAPRLMAGKSGYDVVVTPAALLQLQIRAGLLQKLDRALLPNAAGLWPEVMAHLAVADPDNRFAVDYMWFSAGIAYDASKAKERLAGADPQLALGTWDAVFKPESVRKFSDCGVYALDSPDELFALALNDSKLKPDTRSEGDIAKAADMLFKIRSFTGRIASSELVGALARGDVCLAIARATDVAQARSRARASGEDVDIGFVVPPDGTLMWLDSLAVPRDAPHVADAHKFIDFLLRPDIAARNTKATGLANGVAASKPLIDPRLLADPSIYPTDDVVRREFLVPTYEPRIRQAIVKLWTKLRAAK